MFCSVLFLPFQHLSLSINLPSSNSDWCSACYHPMHHACSSGLILCCPSVHHCHALVSCVLTPFSSSLAAHLLSADLRGGKAALPCLVLYKHSINKEMRPLAQGRDRKGITVNSHFECEGDKVGNENCHLPLCSIRLTWLSWLFAGGSGIACLYSVWWDTPLRSSLRN